MTNREMMLMRYLIKYPQILKESLYSYNDIFEIVKVEITEDNLFSCEVNLNSKSKYHSSSPYFDIPKEKFNIFLREEKLKRILK